MLSIEKTDSINFNNRPSLTILRKTNYSWDNLEGEIPIK